MVYIPPGCTLRMVYIPLARTKKRERARSGGTEGSAAKPSPQVTSRRASVRNPRAGTLTMVYVPPGGAMRNAQENDGDEGRTGSAGARPN